MLNQRGAQVIFLLHFIGGIPWSLGLGRTFSLEGLNWQVHFNAKSITLPNFSSSITGRTSREKRTSLMTVWNIWEVSWFAYININAHKPCSMICLQTGPARGHRGRMNVECHKAKSQQSIVHGLGCSSFCCAFCLPEFVNPSWQMNRLNGTLRALI